jgi:hypothetical protein
VTLPAELALVLLTYGAALANLARASAGSAGRFEHSATLAEAERKAGDDKLAFAVTLLCRASGVFQHVGDAIVGRWEAAVSALSDLPMPIIRPPELSREVALALAKCASFPLYSPSLRPDARRRMTLADAQVLAARKLLTKASAASAARPGPPLPASHPAPALLAKLHLDAAALYAGARALATTPAPAAPLPASQCGGAKKGGAAGSGAEPAKALRRYLADEAALHAALAHSWLGVDAGEASSRSGSGPRTGEAVGFLAWARAELDALKDGGAKGAGPSVGDAGDREREMRDARRAVVRAERAAVESFLVAYTRENDTVRAPPLWCAAPRHADELWAACVSAGPGPGRAAGSHPGGPHGSRCEVFCCAHARVWPGLGPVHAQDGRGARGVGRWFRRRVSRGRSFGCEHAAAVRRSRVLLLMLVVDGMERLSQKGREDIVSKSRKVTVGLLITVLDSTQLYEHACS